MGKREKKHAMTCKVCGKPFRSAMWYACYCSKKCRDRSQSVLTPRIHRDELERLKRAAGEG